MGLKNVPKKFGTPGPNLAPNLFGLFGQGQITKAGTPLNEPIGPYESELFLSARGVFYNLGRFLQLGGRILQLGVFYNLNCKIRPPNCKKRPRL